MTILFSHQASTRKSHNKRWKLCVTSTWFYKLQVATERSPVNTEQHRTFDRIFELFEHLMFQPMRVSETTTVCGIKG